LTVQQPSGLLQGWLVIGGMVILSLLCFIRAVMGLSQPEHPLISAINYEAVKVPCKTQMSFVFDFYSIVLNRNFKGKRKYGQQVSDFDEGVLFFMFPGQVFSIDVEDEATVQHAGYVLLIHPDFLWNTSLAKTIKKYEYFDYSVNEALHLSAKEEKKVINIIKSIQQEYHEHIDKFRQDIKRHFLQNTLPYHPRA
jgi:hypothetical protein